jgi:hypothetical protein
MEDYDDAAGQAHQQDLLRQQKTEEALGLFSPVICFIKPATYR